MLVINPEVQRLTGNDQAISGLSSTIGTADKNKSTERSFGDILSDRIEALNQTQVEADEAVRRLAAGQETNIHHTMLQLEEADLSMRMAFQVRNKVLDAYQEVMHMQV